MLLQRKVSFKFCLIYVVPLNSGEKPTWPILGKQPHSSQVDLKVQAFLNLTLKANKVFIYLPELDIVNGI